jgi:ribulose-5-phosphate 4-epimerase/fuculose-1-phosphate aldolase
MNRKTLGVGLALGAGLLGFSVVWAQTAKSTPATSNSAAASDQIGEVVLANHILSMTGVLDAYGHVSVRSQRNPNHYFLARSRPPGVITAADIVEYDFDSKAVDGNDAGGYAERFIHGEIYRARADVMAVVHSHPPDVIAFGVTGVPLRPLFHMAGFIGDPPPVFEIRNAGGMTDMLIRNPDLGKALAKTLANRNVVLLRGHGAVVAAPSLHVVVGMAYYLIENAKLQEQAMRLGGGKVTYLEPEEAKKAGSQDGFERAWTLWKAQATAK